MHGLCLWAYYIYRSIHRRELYLLVDISPISTTSQLERDFRPDDGHFLIVTLYLLDMTFIFQVGPACLHRCLLICADSYSPCPNVFHLRCLHASFTTQLEPVGTTLTSHTLFLLAGSVLFKK